MRRIHLGSNGGDVVARLPVCELLECIMRQVEEARLRCVDCGDVNAVSIVV